MSDSTSRIITVFGSHNPKPGSADYVLAEELGNAISDAGFTAATGGYGGIMEGVLKGAGGGIGYTATLFSAEPNRFVMEERVSNSLFDRIETMLNESEALVCMTGGTGTLLELAAAWEFVNKKIIQVKPIICLGKFWDSVIATLSAEPTVDNIHSLKNQNESATRYIHQAGTAKETIDIIKAYYQE